MLYDAAEAQQALDFLQANGFRRAALPLYSGGATTWPLPQAANPLGIPLDPRLPAPSSTQDLLVAMGQRGLERVGWLEFGLMAPADAPWLHGHDDLLLQDDSGSRLWPESPGLDRVWLNPLRPEVREVLIDLVVQACTQLPLDVVQLDDHLGYPARFGYDTTTLALWRRTPEGARNPRPSPSDPTWISWRAKQVTQLLVAIRAVMTRACPSVRLSVAPNPQDFSYASYLADWSSWIRLGLVDEVVLQIYRQDPQRLLRELEHPSVEAARNQVPIRIGLLAGLKNQPKDPAVLQQELQLARERGFRGVDLFFYETARQHFHATP